MRSPISIIQLLVTGGFAVYFAVEYWVSGENLCMLIFLGIFALATLWGMSDLRKRRRLKKLSKRSHRQTRKMSAPWSARHDWHTGKIKPDERDYLNVVGRALVSAVWLLVGLTIAYDLLPRYWDRWDTWIVLLIMVVFPTIILVRTPAALRRMELSSEGLLLLDWGPGPIHDRFLATMQLPGASAAGPVHASLVCVERTFRTMGGGHSSGGKGDAFRGSSSFSVGQARSDEELWRCEVEIEESMLVQRDGILSVPIDITLPPDFAETTCVKPGTPGVVWKVEIKGETREGPVEMTFEVPVFSDAEGECHQT